MITFLFTDHIIDYLKNIMMSNILINFKLVWLSTNQDIKCIYWNKTLLLTKFFKFHIHVIVIFTTYITIIKLIFNNSFHNFPQLDKLLLLDKHFNFFSFNRSDNISFLNICLKPASCSLTCYKWICLIFLLLLMRVVILLLLIKLFVF